MSKLTKSQLEAACGHCSHFTGIGNEACAVGVFYEQFTGSLPCLQQFDKGQFTCEKRRWVTAEEAQAEEDERVQHMELLNKALPIVSECKKLCSKGGPCSFLRVCPGCGTDLVIHISRYNLHARVCCKTKGCVNWIE